MPDLQTIIVLALVLVAAAFFVRKFTRKKEGGCGSCESGCSNEDKKS